MACWPVPRLGALLALLVGFIYSSEVAVCRVALGKGINPMQGMMYRGILQLILTSGMLAKANASPLSELGGMRWYLLHGFFASTAIALVWRALRDVPLSEMIVLYNTAPLWGVLIGSVFLRERLTLVKIFAALLVIAGPLVMVVFGPSRIHGSHTVGVVCGCLAGFTDSLRIVFNRRAAVFSNQVAASIQSQDPVICQLQQTVVSAHAGRLLFLSALFVTCIGSCASFGSQFHVIHDPTPFLILVGMSAMSSTSQYLQVKAMKLESVAVVSVLATFDILFSLGWQVLLFPEEKMNWSSVLGALLVFAGGVLVICDPPVEEAEDSEARRLGSLKCSYGAVPVSNSEMALVPSEKGVEHNGNIQDVDTHKLEAQNEGLGDNSQPSLAALSV